MVEKIIQRPTQKSIFTAKLKGKPIDMTGAYVNLDQHREYLKTLCFYGILEIIAYGILVVYPIKVTLVYDIPHTSILMPGLEVQEYGVFRNFNGVWYKKWIQD